MTVIAFAILLLLLPLTVFDLVRRPTIRRLGLRNVTRRRGEAALVIGGSMLATALITASFVVGDSFGGSVRSLAQDQWGPVDELAVVDDRGEQLAVVEAIEAVGSADVDGVLPASFVRVAIGAGVSDGAESSRVEPRVRLIELEPADAAGFGGDVNATGLGALSAGLGPDEILLNDAIAEDLAVEVGDEVSVFVAGEEQAFEVAHVVPRTGLAGIGQAVVAEGAVTAAFTGGSDSSIDPELASAVTTLVFVSNTGDVYGGADLTVDVQRQLEPAIAAAAGVPIDLEPIKADLLEAAEEEAAGTTELFGTIGGFSVAAGILLLINLFVMLAAERTVELGTMRAVGMRRGAVLRAFALEGAVYGAVAAVVGAVLGVGVGAVVTAYAAGVVAGDEFTISLSIVPMSMVSGAVIGFAISQLTVVLTSARTTKMNIVRALRDLPSASRRQSGWRTIAASIAGISAAVAAYLALGDSPIVAMLAPVVGAVSFIPILARIIPRRIAVVAGCSAGLAWSALVFGLLPEVMDDPDVSIFLLQGVLLVGLAVTMAAVLDPVWTAIAGAVGGRGVSARLGLAHPLARPVRSALLVSMYSLVIFTVTFMAVMNAVFTASTPELARQAGGSYEIFLDTNETSPLTSAELEARSDIDRATPILTRGIDVRLSDGGDDSYPASFIEPSFTEVTPPPLVERADAFGTDAEAWRAVATSAGGTTAWMVAPAWSELEAGEQLEVVTDDGSVIEVVVAGVADQTWLVGSGAHLSAELAPAILGTVAPAERFYLTTVEGADVDEVARSLNADGVQRGVDARSFLGEAVDETASQEGFIKMLQGYLGLGLLIGIAGLGVVLVRAVRERRRQLGMMRALGIRPETVRGTFLVEAGFIGFQGVALGIGLGLLSAWQTLTRSTAFEEGLTFAIPGWWLAGLGLLAFSASLLAALAPAVRAGRTPPAVALRVSG